MSKLWFVFVLAFMPTASAAHNWLDSAPDLTEARVIAVIEAVRQVDPDDLLSKPTAEDSFEFLREIAILVDDESGDTDRVLFMFEAIRRGLIASELSRLREPDRDWHRVAAAKDYEHVVPFLDVLQTWLSTFWEE